MKSCSGAPAIAAIPNQSMVLCSPQWHWRVPKNPQEFQYLGKRVDAAEKKRQENVRSSVGEAPFGVVFDDQLGWLCLILIIP